MKYFWSIINSVCLFALFFFLLYKVDYIKFLGCIIFFSSLCLFGIVTSSQLLRCTHLTISLIFNPIYSLPEYFSGSLYTNLTIYFICLIYNLYFIKIIKKQL